jgi:hypothetical protein
MIKDMFGWVLTLFSVLLSLCGGCTRPGPVRVLVPPLVESRPIAIPQNAPTGEATPVPCELDVPWLEERANAPCWM